MQLIYLVVLLLVASVAEAVTTYNLPDCAQATVQSYVNSASDDDILVCPAGTWTYTTITNGVPSVRITKAITLVGAGYDIVNNVATSQTTTIVDATPQNDWVAGNVPFSFTGVAGKKSRITGFTFTGYEESGFVRVGGPAFWKLFRMDHNRSIGQVSVVHFSAVYGLVDHNYFNNQYPKNTIVIEGIRTGADSSFLKPNPAGTDNAVYVEDNTFNAYGTSFGAGDFDCDDGGHMVIRYNTFINAGIQTHDTLASGLRGCRHWEIYNNTFTTNSNVEIAWHDALRAGTGVIHNNVTTGRYTHPTILTNYRSWILTEYISPANWGWCDGTATSNCDGNYANYHPASNGSAISGYPCMDQIARISDTNTNGYACYQSDVNPGAQQTTIDPVYAWNNKWNNNIYSNPAVTSYSILVFGGCKVNDNGVNICVTDHIKANREFFDYVASFDGTQGTGTGLLANRPSTCTANVDGPGVGYYATDTGKLYKCTATNTWTDSYQPYTCPYPGWGIAGTCNTAVAGLSGYPADAVSYGPYTVTPSVSYHGTPYGTISPSTAQTVTAGETITFTVTPDTGSHVYSINTVGNFNVVNPSPLASGGTSTVGPVNGSGTFTVTFGQIITESAGAGGTLSCTDMVPNGEPGTCTTSPSGGYHTSGISGCGISWVSGNSATTSNLTADCTVTATFAANEWLVTGSGGSHGTVSPASQVVANNGSANFTITPESGYYVSISGTCPAPSHVGNVYTFSPITAGCSFTASFLPLSVGGGGQGGARSKNGKVRVSNGALKAR